MSWADRTRGREPHLAGGAHHAPAARARGHHCLAHVVLEQQLAQREAERRGQRLELVLVALDVGFAGHVYVHLNNHGWESNRLLAIGFGGGIGWLLLLNVWGIVWRIQKRIIGWSN